MHKHRLDALTDGIFAVAMTLLVIDLKLPETAVHMTTEAILQGLADLLPKLFLGDQLPGAGALLVGP